MYCSTNITIYHYKFISGVVEYLNDVSSYYKSYYLVSLRRSVYIAPIGGKTNPSYLRNRPTSWLNGCVIVEVMEGGYFNVFPVIVTKGRFAYGGKIYGGK